MDSRIAQRRMEAKRVRARLRLRRVVGAAAILALLGLGYWLEQSPLLGLSEVEVVGTRRLSPDAVREAAALPLGTSTLRLRLRPARERVEALPLVHSAAVRRTDPLTVRIKVVERSPTFVLRARGGEALVDATGIVVAPGGEDGLPVIATSEPHEPEAGLSVAEMPEVHNAFAVASALPGPLRADVVRYEARAPDDVVVVLANGLLARFGRAERVPEKARALGALLSELGASAAGASVDIRAPSHPVLLPAASSLRLPPPASGS
ncbi:MAG: FtsQ-type POTRA domain-containing protein [Actinomycetota bacterium]|nr:FtsQ-type POTRA domain-containing protein [Actinomycetota bacterium]